MSEQQPQVETEGQRQFRGMVVNSLAGKCICGRGRNKQGVWCCRMCRENYGSHSHLCEKRTAQP